MFLPSFLDISVNMASGESSCKRSRIRTSLAVQFSSQAEKTAFNRRLESVKSLLTANGSRSIDNYSMLISMFDLVEQSFPPRPPNSGPPPLSSGSTSFNSNHGEFLYYFVHYNN